MNQTLKTFLSIALVLLIIAAGYWLFKAPVPQAPQVANNEPIRIGFIAPLTGDAAVYGDPIRNVTALAVDEINKAGGVDGKMLEVVYEDGRCNGKDAVSAAQKLVNVDKVQFILGGFCSEESLAAIPVAEPAKVVLLSVGSSSPDLTGKSPYFFRDYPSDASQGKVLADFAEDTKKWKNMAIIQEQTDYSVGIYKAFSANFGGKMTKEEFSSATTDFRSSLTKLKGTNPDALFIIAQTSASAERILKQMKELNWKPALLLNDGITGDPKVMMDNKDMVEGAIGAEFGIDLNNTKFKGMIEAYKAKHGQEPPYQSYMQTAYDGVYILLDGLKAVGNNGEKLAAWSRTINNWQGASGSVTIQPDGDRVGGHTLKVVKDGKVEIYQ